MNDTAKALIGAAQRHLQLVVGVGSTQGRCDLRYSRSHDATDENSKTCNHYAAQSNQCRHVLQGTFEAVTVEPWLQLTATHTQPGAPIPVYKTVLPTAKGAVGSYRLFLCSLLGDNSA